MHHLRVQHCCRLADALQLCLCGEWCESGDKEKSGRGGKQGGTRNTGLQPCTWLVNALPMSVGVKGGVKRHRSHRGISSAPLCPFGALWTANGQPTLLQLLPWTAVPAPREPPPLPSLHQPVSPLPTPTQLYVPCHQPCSSLGSLNSPWTQNASSLLAPVLRACPSSDPAAQRCLPKPWPEDGMCTRQQPT